MERPLQTYAPRPDRLAAVLDYANDRAGYLDVRERVERAVGAYDPEPVSPELAAERAEAVIAAVHEATAIVLARRLSDPKVQAAMAASFVAMVVP